MTDVNRAASRINWVAQVKAAGSSELEAAPRRGRSVVRTAALTAFAFGIGALTATAVHTFREDTPRTSTRLEELGAGRCRDGSRAGNVQCRRARF